MEQKDIIEIKKLKKVKLIENDALKTMLYVTGGILGSVIIFFTQLIVNNKINLKTGIFVLCIIILLVILFSLIIVILLYYLKNNELYRKYEEQYKYFINKLNINNNSNKEIKNIKKDINNIKEKQKKSVWFKTEETWDE